MPPSNVFPDTNGFSTFLGDCMGLAVGSDGVAHPVWTDSRNPIFMYNPTAADPRVPVFAGVDSDVYTATIKDKAGSAVEARPWSGLSIGQEGPARPAPPSSSA